MAANIFGNRFAGNRQPAWHNIGTVFTEPKTAIEAVKLAKLDYGIFKAPMLAGANTIFGNSMVEVPGKVVILREPTDDDPDYRYFGIASENYGLLQNTEVAEIVDALTDQWPVETVGALGNGETVFFSLDAGEAEVKGEQLRQYFLVTDTRDGGTSMKIAFTPVRVVCQNTLVTGLRQATVSSAIPHSTNFESVVKFRVDLVKKLQRAREMTIDVFNRMATVAITPEQFDEVLESSYPYPARPAKASSVEGFEEDDIAVLGELYGEATAAQEQWEYYCTRVDAFRDGARELFAKLNDEHTGIAGTAWAAYNAVVEAEDYREGAASVFQSNLWGARAQTKRRAFKAASSLTPVKGGKRKK